MALPIAVIAVAPFLTKSLDVGSGHP